MNGDPRGIMIQQGNVMRINNAFVEEASCFNNTSGFLIVSYAVQERNNTVSIQTIRLNLNRNTTIVGTNGRPVCLCCLEKGMWINAVFSSRMTRSIPPQANAILIAVQRNAQPPAPPVSTTTGRILLIDFDDRFFLLQEQGNPRNQIRFNVTRETAFINRFGVPIRFGALRTGERVRVKHANFMTASIPPQTTAFEVRIL